MKKKIQDKIISILAFLPLPKTLWKQLFRILLALIVNRNSEKALKILLESETDLNLAINYTATRYEGGIHPKHRLMKYHDFFIERIEPGETVLDIGCGYGAVAYSIALQAKALVTGIDNNPENISIANEKYSSSNLTFILADIRDWIPDKQYKIIVLSNVLEHIEDRVNFLVELQKRFSPKRWLIRVPMINREWKVPMRRELGLSFFSDPTHFTEYTEESFLREITNAKLFVKFLTTAWGEIWSEIVPE